MHIAAFTRNFACAALVTVVGICATPNRAHAQSHASMDAKVKDYLLRNAKRTEVEEIIKDYLEKHPEAVQRVVREYILKNPDVLQEALAMLIRGKANQAANNAAPAPAPAPDKSAAIKDNTSAIFNSPRQVNLGNAQGDVTLVEFFDYNCGFCKRALADKLALMKSDPKLKIVLKEFPVLGPGSTEAAQVAVAVRMQDPGGQKYLAFHEKLLASPRADKAQALAVAGEAGLDVTRIERDMTSSEINDTLAESRRLAGVLGINGTPSYVVGDQVVVGAVGLANLSDKIKVARK